MKFIIKTDLNKEMPKGFGLFYQTFLPPVRVCVRFPLNLPLRLGWWIYSWARTPFPRYRSERDELERLILLYYGTAKDISSMIDGFVSDWSRGKYGARKCITGIQKYTQDQTKILESVVSESEVFSRFLKRRTKSGNYDTDDSSGDPPVPAKDSEK